MADSHFLIEKTVKNSSTATKITLLGESGVIDELSRLSGGSDISENSDAFARELKNWSKQYKATIG
jgi:DNA repair protein RecN (Recombination protein N)